MGPVLCCPASSARSTGTRAGQVRAGARGPRGQPRGKTLEQSQEPWPAEAVVRHRGDRAGLWGPPHSYPLQAAHLLSTLPPHLGRFSDPPLNFVLEQVTGPRSHSSDAHTTLPHPRRKTTHRGSVASTSLQPYPSSSAPAQSPNLAPWVVGFTPQDTHLSLPPPELGPPEARILCNLPQCSTVPILTGVR